MEIYYEIFINMVLKRTTFNLPFTWSNKKSLITSRNGSKKIVSIFKYTLGSC
jgi:hypothetical protein